MLRSVVIALVAALLHGAAGGAAPAGHASGARRSQSGWSGAGLVSAPGGPYFRDAAGRRLQLHGVGLVAKCGGGAIPSRAPGTPCVGPARGRAPAFVLTPSARDPGRRFTDADAQTIASLGFNVVRLGVVWEGLEPGPRGVGPDDPTYCAPHRAGTPFPALGSADPYDGAVLARYLRRVDTIVAELGRHGIRVIIDMHQDAFGSAFRNPHSPTPWNGEGAPVWATCTDGVAFHAPRAWYAGNHNPAIEAADHNLMANDVRGDLQGQFMRVWQAVARHFRGDPEVIGYELLNEPADFTLPALSPELQCDYGGPVHAPASCAASGAQAPRDGWIGAIQTVDPGHVIFYEPPITNTRADPETIGIAEPLRFSDVADAFHLYHPPSRIASFIKPQLARTVTDQPGGPPTIMDEFGASRHAPAATVATADADGLSWSYWAALQLHDPTGNPREYLLAQRTRRPAADKARALAVPYPFATAGRPGQDTFASGPRRLDDTYAPDHSITAPTEIEVPPATYPGGYRVRVSGARVVSAPGAAILKLSARRGARRVSITLAPRAGAG